MEKNWKTRKVWEMHQKVWGSFGKKFGENKLQENNFGRIINNLMERFVINFWERKEKLLEKNERKVYKISRNFEKKLEK